MKARHVGGDRTRNGLPESCSGYVYRGTKHDAAPPAPAGMDGRGVFLILYWARRHQAEGKPLRDHERELLEELGERGSVQRSVQ